VPGERFQEAIMSSSISDKSVEREKPILVAQINPTGLSDIPTGQDGIGFKPYVRAIAWFLSNENTKPPLTMSVEGPWGSGKSSFMLQLQSELEAQNLARYPQYYVRFNAWRSDKDEALWAAFALTFIKQLEQKTGIRKRVIANILLLWNRVEWKRGWLQLVQFALYFLVFMAATIYAARHSELIVNPKIETIVVGAPWLAALYFGWDKAKKILGTVII
jgi:hypothetical protein